MTQALENISVLDLSNYIAGPFAAMLLADMGAKVVKIENTDGGDPFRKWGREPKTYSPLFRSYNRNKKSMTLNLRTEEGRRLLLRMVEQADVLIENFRPGVVDRLGINYGTSQSLNPRLIYCSISAFGQQGPYRDKPGFDTIGQCLSGLLSQISDPAVPQGPGLAFSDHLSGMYACYGILTALMARERSGRGQKVETSLMEASMAFIGRSITEYFATGDVPRPDSRSRQAGVFALLSGDGLPFVIHLSHLNKFFVSLANACERPDLLNDARFQERDGRSLHYDALRQILQDIVKTQTRAHWLKVLTEHDVATAPINRMDEVFEDSQVKHLQPVLELEHPDYGTMHTVRSGVNLSETPFQVSQLPPKLGEHNAELLSALGYDREGIEAMRIKGIV